MPEVAFRSDVAVFDIGQIFRSDPGRALEARGLSPNVILSSRSHQASCGFPLMIFILSTRLRSRCGLAPGCRLWVNGLNRSRGRGAAASGMAVPAMDGRWERVALRRGPEAYPQNR